MNKTSEALIDLEYEPFNSEAPVLALVKQNILSYAKQIESSEEKKFTVQQAKTMIQSESNPLIRGSAESLIRRCLSDLVDDGYLHCEPGSGRRPSYYFFNIKEDEATQESSNSINQIEHKKPVNDIPVTVSNNETPKHDFLNTVANKGSSSEMDSSPEKGNEKLPGSKPPAVVEILQKALERIAALEKRVTDLENQSPTHLESYLENLLEEFDRPAK